MKSNCIFYVVLIFIFISCQNKNLNNSQTELNSLHVNISEANLSSNADSIDLTKISRLTQQEYDSLQLGNINGLEGYYIEDFSHGKLLLENQNGKLLTIKVITDGEISEYLLSYDKNGDLNDNLLVAYEDMVEYYSQVSSTINSNEITVQTIKFTYDDSVNEGSDDNMSEKADTIISKYQITPELKFIIF